MADLERVIAEIRDYPRAWIPPSLAAKVTGQDPHFIRLQARDDPAAMGYPVQVCGSRTRIPKESFLRFWLGETNGI